MMDIHERYKLHQYLSHGRRLKMLWCAECKRYEWAEVLGEGYYRFIQCGTEIKKEVSNA